MRIKTETITAVLLADGRWHEVTDNTFRVGEYTYSQPVGDGYSEDQRLDEQGFQFREAQDGVIGGSVVAGPVRSILAVKIKP